MNAARLTGVSVEASGARILDDVSLEIPHGRIIAVVGSNGAGKTTLLDAISGTIAIAAGSVDIEGTENPGRSGLPRPGVGRVFQGSPLPETMTVAEVLAMVVGGARAAKPVLARFGLTEHETTFVAELSTGMRRILDLAVAACGAPPVLLLDEPASGLAQSEIEHLADVLRALRDQTDAGIVLVEHDAWLVKAVADEIVVMDEGRIVEQGTPQKILAATRAQARPRVTSPHDESFDEALARVGETSAPAPPLVRRSLSTWTILRLGLREFAAGLSSVLILGVLSRVLKVELGISLGAVAAILATYNLAAPLGLPIGHMSDTRPLFGRRRIPYILIGSVITGLAVAAAPHVAGRLAGGVSPAAVILSVALFVFMGIGMYGAGTAFFALIADIASPAERGHVAKVIYLELLGGVFLGVALTGALVHEEATGSIPSGVYTVFALAGFVIVALTALAVVGQERHAEITPEAQAHSAARVPFRTVLSQTVRIPQARLFFGFMVASTLFLFLQQAVLQPFGGDVFGMSVSQTSGLSAMVTTGTIIGMVVAGRPFAAQVGYLKVARWGLYFSVVSFGVLTLAAITTSVPATWLSLIAVGFGLGFFNVAALALMMGMATRARAAFFMGAWTVAHALADGTATAGGGIIYTVSHWITSSVSGGYATVFAIEAIGLALCLPLLSRVDPDRFATEAASLAMPDADVAAVDIIPVEQEQIDAVVRS